MEETSSGWNLRGSNMEKTAKNGLVKLKYPMVIIQKKNAMIFFHLKTPFFPYIRITVILSHYYIYHIIPVLSH